MDRRVFTVGAASLFAVAASGAAAFHLSKPRVMRWRLVTDQGGFGDRDVPKVFEYGGRHWMSGGWKYPGEHYNDLLSCDEPGKWEMVNAQAPYAPYSPIGVHEGEIWVVDDKVRKTRDGINFETVAETVPFQIVDGLIVQDGSHLVSLNGQIHIILPGAVWSSPDGLDWTLTKAPYGARSATTVLVYDGAVHVVGGAIDEPNAPPGKGYPGKTSFAEIWSSKTPSDANSWKMKTAPWSKRMWAGAVEHDGYLYVGAGYYNVEGRNLDDIWRYSWLTGWQQIPTTENFTAHHGAQLMSRDGFLYLIAGNNNPYGTTSDVWVLEDAPAVSV